MKTPLHLLFIFSILVCQSVQAQNYTTDSETRINVKDVKSFQNTILLVVVDSEESLLGKTIMDAFNKYWKIGSFKFIGFNDVDRYLDNEAYSVFAFMQHVAIGGAVLNNSGGPVSGHYVGNGTSDYAAFIDPGYDMDNSNASIAMYGYGIFLCGTGIKKTNYSRKSLASCNGGLMNLHMVDELSVIGGVDAEFPVKYIGTTISKVEYPTIQYIPFYIERLAKHIGYISDNGKLPETKETTVEIPYEYDGKEKDAKATIVNYNDGLSKVKDLKILIDSSSADKLGKEMFVKSLGLSEDKVVLASLKDIQNAIEQRDAGVAVMYGSSIGIWATDGTRLIDWTVKGINKRHSGNGIDRSKIQLK